MAIVIRELPAFLEWSREEAEREARGEREKKAVLDLEEKLTVAEKEAQKKAQEEAKEPQGIYPARGCRGMVRWRLWRCGCFVRWRCLKRHQLS